MERRYEIDHLWSLSITKKAGWQQDNSPIVRGDYGDLESAWKKATKSMVEHQRDALMKEIESAIHTQKEFRRQQRASEQFVPQPVMISVFINKKRWKDDVIIEDKKEVKKLNQRICDHPECNNEVMGPLFKKCALHHSLANMSVGR